MFGLSYRPKNRWTDHVFAYRAVREFWTDRFFVFATENVTACLMMRSATLLDDVCLAYHLQPKYELF